MPSFRSSALAAAVLSLLMAGCRSAPRVKVAQESAPSLYRFDDHLAAATVAASAAAPSVLEAERVVWHFDRQPIPWDLLRGRMGFKPGQLIVEGEGNTPVIASPASPAVDWSRYEAVLVRMISEGGSEIKIKLGATELRQKMAPPMHWQVYRFDLPPSPPGFLRPLAIMPTDDMNAPVAIDFIELVPRRDTLAEPVGRTSVARRDEFRNAIYARCPAAVAFEVPVPRAAPHLRFGLGVSQTGPVTFRVLAGPSKTEVFSRAVSDAGSWEEADVDLARYAGTTTRLVFQTDSGTVGALGLWANPLLMSRVPASRPNVLLYVVCTLRPDHTSLYGYSRDTTPFLKRLGASSVVFDDVTAQAPWTKASVPSLLTSLQAYTHRLVNESDTIPRNAVTLAEQLRSAGYVTASIVANPLAGRASGLDRGFDFVMDYPVVQRQRTDAVDRGTDSAAINRAILPWLGRHRDEPLFLFILAADPHAPYRPPAEFEKLYANPAETPQFNRDYQRLRDVRAYGGGAAVSWAEIRAKGIDPDAFKRRAIDRYDGEIAHNDKSLETLLARLREDGLLDHTLVVVASDHGEEFWEHGFGAHGHALYSELIRAVLLMWNPKLLPPPRRLAEPVQLIDVMPTILDLLGLKAPAGLEGQSLVPLLKGLPFHRNGSVMSTKLARPKAESGGGVPESATDTIARIDADWKLIYRRRAARAGLKVIELYDRRHDRADGHDLAPQQRELAGRLRLEILNWIQQEDRARQQVGEAGKTTLDRNTLERLRSLGYLGGKSNDEK